MCHGQKVADVAWSSIPSWESLQWDTLGIYIPGVEWIDESIF